MRVTVAIAAGLAAGCAAINAGPVVGWRQHHASLGWTAGGQISDVGGDVGQSFRLGGQAPGGMLTYFDGRASGELGDTHFGAAFAFGFAGGDGASGVLVSGALADGHVLERSRPRTAGWFQTDRAVVGLVWLGLRWIANSPEVWLSPQLALAWLPDPG